MCLNQDVGEINGETPVSKAGVTKGSRQLQSQTSLNLVLFSNHV